jgi:copper(I)-binding protein
VKNKGVSVLFLLGLAALVLAACGAPPGPAIEIEDAWARPAMVGEGSGESGGMAAPGTGAVFMRIINSGREDDRLLLGFTDVADVVEIHETVMEGDVMRMQMLTQGLEIPARDEVVLQPGGYHVMLIGVKEDLNVGDTFELTLSFQKTGQVTVQPEVRQP